MPPGRRANYSGVKAFYTRQNQRRKKIFPGAVTSNEKLKRWVRELLAAAGKDLSACSIITVIYQELNGEQQGPYSSVFRDSGVKLVKVTAESVAGGGDDDVGSVVIERASDVGSGGVFDEERDREPVQDRGLMNIVDRVITMDEMEVSDLDDQSFEGRRAPSSQASARPLLALPPPEQQQTAGPLPRRDAAGPAAAALHDDDAAQFDARPPAPARALGEPRVENGAAERDVPALDTAYEEQRLYYTEDALARAKRDLAKHREESARRERDEKALVTKVKAMEDKNQELRRREERREPLGGIYHRYGLSSFANCEDLHGRALKIYGGITNNYQRRFQEHNSTLQSEDTNLTMVLIDETVARGRAKELEGQLIRLLTLLCRGTSNYWNEAHIPDEFEQCECMNDDQRAGAGLSRRGPWYIYVLYRPKISAAD